MWGKQLLKTQSVNVTPCKLYPGSLITPSELDRLSNLHSLALDFTDLTSELCGLLASPCRTPLHRLSLLLNGAALEFKPLEGTATEEDWKALVMHLCLLILFPLTPKAFNNCNLRSRRSPGSRERQPASVHHGPGGGQLGAPQDPEAQPTSGAPPPRQLPRAGVRRHFGINITAVQQDIDSLPAPEG